MYRHRVKVSRVPLKGTNKSLKKSNNLCASTPSLVLRVDGHASSRPEARAIMKRPIDRVPLAARLYMLAIFLVLAASSPAQANKASVGGAKLVEETSACSHQLLLRSLLLCEQHTSKMPFAHELFTLAPANRRRSPTGTRACEFVAAR